MTPNAKLELVRQQVISKIRWGSSEEEVLLWLSQSHGIVGAEADRLLGDAERAKRKAIREKAVTRLVVSGLLLALFVVFGCIALSNGWIIVGQTMGVTVLVLGVGLVILISFFRSLGLLLTGNAQGPVD